jgi:hypothetical protein
MFPDDPLVRRVAGTGLVVVAVTLLVLTGLVVGRGPVPPVAVILVPGCVAGLAGLGVALILRSRP